MLAGQKDVFRFQIAVDDGGIAQHAQRIQDLRSAGCCVVAEILRITDAPVEGLA